MAAVPRDLQRSAESDPDGHVTGNPVETRAVVPTERSPPNADLHQSWPKDTNSIKCDWQIKSFKAVVCVLHKYFNLEETEILFQEVWCWFTGFLVQVFQIVTNSVCV